MKVWFTGETAQESLRFGVLLTPGENEIADEKAPAMLACGLVQRDRGSKRGVLSARDLAAAKEPREA